MVLFWKTFNQKLYSRFARLPSRVFITDSDGLFCGRPRIGFIITYTHRGLPHWRLARQRLPKVLWSAVQTSSLFGKTCLMSSSNMFHQTFFTEESDKDSVYNTKSSSWFVRLCSLSNNLVVILHLMQLFFSWIMSQNNRMKLRYRSILSRFASNSHYDVTVKLHNAHSKLAFTVSGQGSCQSCEQVIGFLMSDSILINWRIRTNITNLYAAYIAQTYRSNLFLFWKVWISAEKLFLYRSGKFYPQPYLLDGQKFSVCVGFKVDCRISTLVHGEMDTLKFSVNSRVIEVSDELGINLSKSIKFLKKSFDHNLCYLCWQEASQYTIRVKIWSNIKSWCSEMSSNSVRSHTCSSKKQLHITWRGRKPGYLCNQVVQASWLKRLTFSQKLRDPGRK